MRTIEFTVRLTVTPQEEQDMAYDYEPEAALPLTPEQIVESQFALANCTHEIVSVTDTPDREKAVEEAAAVFWKEAVGDLGDLAIASRHQIDTIPAAKEMQDITRRGMRAAIDAYEAVLATQEGNNGG